MPADPLPLWNKYRERMADDYFFQLHANMRNGQNELTEQEYDQLYQRALGDIEFQLQPTGHHLTEFPTLPQQFILQFSAPPHGVDVLARVEQVDYNFEEQQQLLKNMLPTLNTEQRHAFDTIITSLYKEPDDQTARLFFVNGPGGTGKSLLFKALLAQVRSQDDIALPVATSGIAAILLPGISIFLLLHHKNYS